MVFVNSDVVTDKVSRTDLTAYYIPCSQIADEVGNPKVSNMVMLGAYVAGTKVLKAETIEKMIQEMFTGAKAKFVPLNIEAFRRGGLRAVICFRGPASLLTGPLFFGLGPALSVHFNS